jgi:hypothetical protein
MTTVHFPGQKDTVSKAGLPLGFYAAVVITILTTISFIIALLTPPLSGPLCLNDCFSYPYHEIASRFPRDYIWMYFSIVLYILLPVLFISFWDIADAGNKKYVLLATGYATIAVTILIATYFIQLSVVQASLIKGEYDGIALLTQFNPHGTFIASEEIGYSMICISLFALSPLFKGSHLRMLRIVLKSGLFMAVISFLAIVFIYGNNRETIFEILIISIAWLQLIVAGILISRFFYSTRG